MQSGNQLSNWILSEIVVLDKKIEDRKTGFFTPQGTIDFWLKKKNILEVALGCLSGEKSLEDLNTAMKHTFYNDDTSWMSFFNEVVSLEGTKNLVNEVTRIMPPTNYFFLLPPHVMLSLLACYLDDLIDIINVAKTEKNCYSLFQRNRKEILSKILLPDLLLHTALGEWDAAERLLSKYPELLLKSKYEFCHSGELRHRDRALFQGELRHRDRVPFQIACFRLKYLQMRQETMQRENEIKQLTNRIVSELIVLAKNIEDRKTGFFTPQGIIDFWLKEKNILEVALGCLSGENSLEDLNTATKPNFYNDDTSWMSFFSEAMYFDSTSFERTMRLVDKVTRLKTPTNDLPYQTKYFTLLPNK